MSKQFTSNSIAPIFIYLDQLSGARCCISWPANSGLSYTHISYHDSFTHFFTIKKSIFGFVFLKIINRLLRAGLPVLWTLNVYILNKVTLFMAPNNLTGSILQPRCKTLISDSDSWDFSRNVSHLHPSNGNRLNLSEWYQIV